MESSTLVKFALRNSLAATVYVAAVASFLYYGPKNFGPAHNVLVPIAFLLLFVVSAAITGTLILLQPARMYLDGSKKDGVNLLVYTIGFLLLFTVIAILIVIVVETAQT